jgi:hypothetical protein
MSEEVCTSNFRGMKLTFPGIMTNLGRHMTPEDFVMCNDRIES